LEQFTDSVCVSKSGGGDADLAWISELDPTATNDELSLFVHPEAILFSNPVAVAACMADAVAATAYKPLQALFWCAGSYGTLYPQTGLTATHTSAVKEASLVGTRLQALIHRRGLGNKTYG